MLQTQTNTTTALMQQADGVAASAPLSQTEFDALMTALGPYDRSPVLGIAVSGGADSTALALLAHEWSLQRGGRTFALIVDHGLRRESAREARHVAALCTRWGMSAEVLSWDGDVPVSGVEKAARLMRHELLGEACRKHGLLHLLLAHHRDDQAETATMRKSMGSGPLGLAGMSACVERPHFRLLRPLLSVPKSRLVATLRERGIGWIDDPMNHDLSFARARLRRDGTQPYDPAMGLHRQALEQELAEILPGIVTLDTWGRAQLDRLAVSRLDRSLRHHAVSRIAQTVGGLNYPPRMRRLEALVSNLAASGLVRASLGRCLWRGDSMVTVSRERRCLPHQAVCGGGREVLWDGRFRLGMPSGTWTIGPVSLTQWRDLAAQSGLSSPDGVKNPEFGALPAVHDLEGVAVVPHLGYARDARFMACKVRFAPRQPLVSASFVGTGAMGADRR